MYLTTRQMKTTKLWIVINEESLNTAKGKNNKTAKFKTENEANKWAASRLELWDTKQIWFEHKFIQHNVPLT